MRITSYLKCFILLLVFSLTQSIAFSQNTSIHISGKVINKANQKAIEHVSIQILPVNQQEMDRNIGISTDKNGSYSFNFNYIYPFRIRFSHISFETVEVIISERNEGLEMTVPLTPENILGEDLIVTADLVSEEELTNTETIYKISTVDVQQLASFDVFDLVSTIREVDVATQSMTMQSVNARGFNSGANKRFLQLTDGVDNRAPGLSFPIGNLLGLIDLDVSSVEVLPGPSSTKYGTSALNGVLLMNGRDPFLDQGFSVEAKSGVNNFNLSGDTFISAEGNGMFDIQTRYAKAYADKFAFKITGSIMMGKDWQAQNYDNIGNGGLHESHPDQSGYDGVNTYGDENFIYQKVYADNEAPTSTLRYGPVTRTGYRESSLVDYEINTSKLAASLQYKFSPAYKIKFNGKYGHTNSLYTGDSRVRLEGFKMYQGHAEVDLARLNIKGYITRQNSGDSYDVTYLAQRLIQEAKPDKVWYRDYRIAFQKGIPVFGVPRGNLAEARKFADSENTLLSDSKANARYKPGTPEFEKKVNELINNSDAKNSAAFQDNSSLYHVQSSYTIPDLIENSTIETGVNFRFYDLQSHGTIFPDTALNDITNYEFGGYISVNKKFISNRLNLYSALRADKNENFNLRLNPQIDLNYNVKNNHYLKLSYQYGFRYPGVREQFINKDFGNIRLIGGLAKNTQQYELQENAISLNAVNEFNDAVNSELSETIASPEAYNRTQAQLKHLSILESGIIGPNKLLDIRPEVVNTLETGYKRLFTPELYLDLNYYLNFYQNFIGITRVVKPKTSPTDDLFIASGQINNSLENERYYIYSNSEDQLIVHGASFNLDYISGGFLASLNGTYAKLIQNSDDPITPGFNTPPFKMNLEWGHRSIAPNVGFKMVYRLRTKFFWESSFIDGPIDTYGHFDFQVNIRMPALLSKLKFGVTNLGIEKYYNTYGGPSIGSIIFATYTFNPNMY